MTEFVTTGQQAHFDSPVSAGELRSHALAAAESWNVIHKPTGHGTYATRIESVGASLDALYAELDRLPMPDYANMQGPDPILTMREQPRLMRTSLAEINSMRRKLARLPRVMRAGESEEPRIATVAASYLEATGYVWSVDALKVYLHTVQTEDPLELEELWTVPTVTKFLLLENAVTLTEALLHTPDAVNARQRELLSTTIKSMRDIGNADWITMVEQFVVFDQHLRQDPSETYAHMDFESREMYRKRVAEIAHHAEATEVQVALTALELAREAQQVRITDPRLYLRRAHVGYYLFEEGFPQLAQRIGHRPSFMERLRSFVRRHADDFFIGGIEIITVVLIAVFLIPLIPTYPLFGGLTVAFLLLLLPVTQSAVDLVNNTIAALFNARALPKLDFSRGIPAEYTTLVAVPTLLINEKQIRELVQELEIRFLANPDPHLHFALLTDLPDSVTRPREKDTDPMVDLAISLINELNERYARDAHRHGSFMLLHRHRIFNAQQGVWMGWERKRGKLLDLNKYLKHEFDAFPVKAGNVGVLSHVQYIITLDSDTQLPRGTAQQMVGAMVHPLNRAIIDPDLRIVTQGYGILQPRVGVSVQSASRSRLAAIYSGQTGFDIYTRAVSDVYQDLYGEGIFTGKGIYEVSALHAVLNKRFPRNSLLSHDLIEGAYARVGLATDVEVIDDYPSHYSAYTRRKHRWVRGDWQIAQWLFSRVPDESGKWVRNPISTISRWKILDNLRRSLVEPATFILLIAGWLGLPGGALYWTIATLLLMFAPTFVQVVFSMGRALMREEKGAVRETLVGFGQSVFITLLNVAFLPHQTLSSLDAIIRSLVRRFITGERLLEWETAAEAESARGKITPVDRYLTATPLVTIALAVLVLVFHRNSIWVAAPILLLWTFAGSITLWLNKPPREQQQRLGAADELFLRQHALRIWRYFYQFGGESHNYLIPDNVEEDGLFEAARVSPTNVGLLLNARQAALRFGFLTPPEFAELSNCSLDTITRLPKVRGHVYNWYNTQTLEPLLPITISSVDSGNLAASLFTLRAGAQSVLRESIVPSQMFDGLRIFWSLLLLQKDLPAAVKSLHVPEAGAPLDRWIDWVMKTDASGALHPESGISEETGWWLAETRLRVAQIAQLVHDYAPWMLPEFAPLWQLPQLGLKPDGKPLSIGDAADFADQLDQRLARSWATQASDAPEIVLGEKLRTLMGPVCKRLAALADSLRRVAAEAYRLVDEMDFGFLIRDDRQLLSIGYEVATNTLHEACYDLLASEARIAAFIAVAKGEADQRTWFKLSRTHTLALGQPLLLSWTGTMFEYLMPSLWMRSYPDTLMSRTLNAAVAVQRAFARQTHNIPWGISESGFAKKDDAGHYHYFAYGIPQAALKWDATAGPVVSPYSSFLALGVDALEAIRNLKRMQQAGWVGAFGFYEAADYMESFKRPELVREWMAHHQGMSLLALLNLLDENIVQDWFHANPQLQATELLLHEKPIRQAILKAQFKEMGMSRGRTAQPLRKAS